MRAGVEEIIQPKTWKKGAEQSRGVWRDDNDMKSESSEEL